jgi:hypothetical protein
MSNTSIFFVRFLPETTVDSYIHGSTKLKRKDGWIKVSRATAEELRRVPENPSRKSKRRPLFEVVTHEEALRIEQWELEEAQRGSLSFPTTAPSKNLLHSIPHPALRSTVPTVPAKEKPTVPARAAIPPPAPVVVDTTAVADVGTPAIPVEVTSETVVETAPKSDEDAAWDALEKDLVASPPQTQRKTRAKKTPRSRNTK